MNEAKQKILKIKVIRKTNTLIFRNQIRQYIKYLENRKQLIKLLQKEGINKKQEQFPKKAAIIFIGTRNYVKYLPEYYYNIKNRFLPNTKKTFFVFTDMTKYPFLQKQDIHTVKIKHEGAVTMLKAYEHIEKAQEQLEKHDYIIWLDADMIINTPILEKNFFSHKKPLFAVRHPNFLKNPGPFETNPKSLAGIDKNQDLSTYIQACFWGGQTEHALKLVKELKKRIRTDLKNKTMAKHQDESHLNKYFLENKKLFYIYNPTYAYPDKRPLPKPYKKKILHVYNKKFKS